MPLLHWLTRDEDIRRASRAPYRLLEAVPEHSHGAPDTGNMLIQGDNLEALKALLPYYAGRVKCIYIDPPFNTGQAFADYDDNIEHSIWLAMMYPRLELLRGLLAEDGTIAIHIDDNELGYLIPVTDEIFGRGNRAYICTFKQASATGHKAINPGMVSVANYIVIYAKDKIGGSWKPNKVFTGRERDPRYSQYIENFDAPYPQWKLIPLTKAVANEIGVKAKELKKHLGDAFEETLDQFVLRNADRVVQPARPDYANVGAEVREAIDASEANTSEVFLHQRESHPDMYFHKGMRWLFYRGKLKLIDGDWVSGEPLTNLWTDILSNNLHNEGGVDFPKSKKPEALIKRVFELFTNKNDIVLDSFLGSGTTAAVALKMDRRVIGIERGDHALTLCLPRLRRVVDGDDSGISKAVNWRGGGGFRFYCLGAPVFDEQGRIDGRVRFAALAAHVWFCETGTPYSGKAKSPLLGVYDGTAYYLLYNGILGDKSANGGNVLTGRILERLPKFDGPKIVYGEMSRLGTERLKRERIAFKQIPYDVTVR